MLLNHWVHPSPQGLLGAKKKLPLKDQQKKRYIQVSTLLFFLDHTVTVLGSVDVILLTTCTTILLQPESDALQAAKADMFGILTRQVEEWHPHRVLCKRFNIPDPYPG